MFFFWLGEKLDIYIYSKVTEKFFEKKEMPLWYQEKMVWSPNLAMYISRFGEVAQFI